jgi:hypothetical protein
MVAGAIVLLGVVAALWLAPRADERHRLPFASAALSRRTGIVSLVLGAGVLAALALAFAVQPRTTPQPVRLGAGTTMVVIDVSGSIAFPQYQTIRSTLTALGAERNRHAGLIFFSDSAVLALPPETPSHELAEFGRFFEHDATVAPQQPVPEDAYGWDGWANQQILANPWMDAFAGGTAIHLGLDLARVELQRVEAKRGQVVLLSDLADAGDPRTRGALLRLAQAKLQLKVVPLEAIPQDKRAYLDVFGPSVFSSPHLATAKHPDEPASAPGSAGVVPFAVLALLLLAALEWWRAPVRLPKERG